MLKFDKGGFNQSGIVAQAYNIDKISGLLTSSLFLYVFLLNESVLADVRLAPDNAKNNKKRKKIILRMICFKYPPTRPYFLYVLWVAESECCVSYARLVRKMRKYPKIAINAKNNRGKDF